MAKKQSRSSAKKPLEVSTTSKKPLEEVASTSKKKKQPLVNAPPESLGSDEEMETEEEGDETNSLSEEEDEPKEPVKTLSASAPNVAATVIQTSDLESGSETESGESDTETEPPPPPPAPVASPRTSRKRTSQATTSTDVNATKRAKTETTKKALFQRVWSEEEEIALLQGMVEYKDETGKNPSENLNAVYETVKKSINFEGKSYNQFTSKISSLRKKYWRKNKSYTKHHDLICLELAKKIWGTVLVSSTAVVKSKKKMKVEEADSVRVDGVSDWFERSSLVGALTNLGLVDDESVKSKWNLVSVENKKKLEVKWKLLLAGDFEHLVEKTKFLVEVSSVIANAN